VQYSTGLYCTELYCDVLFCPVLSHAVLYWTALYCTGIFEYILDSVSIVHAPGLPEVLDEALAGVPPPLHIEGFATQASCNFVQLLVLEKKKTNFENQKLKQEH
jgi:hypothetical protein